MAVEKEIIVAIEFGSSNIRGIAGCKNIDGSIQILDIEQMNARNWIRKGVVYNIDKTEMCLRNIVEKMEAELDMHVSRVYVGIGGKSLRTKKNTVSRQFATKTIISQELVDSLYRTNRNTVYSGYEILDVIPQEFRMGLDTTTDPVGVLSNHIEGTYLNVIAKCEVKDYIVRCVEACGLEVAGFFIAPMALAESVLTETEKRSGCALVDFGAETTTVAVYKNNLLRHLAVIPLGGNNITADICALQIEEEEAEGLKIKYGSAFSEQTSEELSKNTLLVSNGRTIEERMLVDIVEAREEEILGNVAAQIRNSGFMEKLISGVVISGGASGLKNIDKAIANRVKLDKCRLARIVPLSLSAVRPEQLVKDGTLNTLLALLNVGTVNCVEARIPEEVVVQPEEETVVGEQEKEQQVVAPVTPPAEEPTTEEKVKEEKPKKPKQSKIGAWKKLLQKMTDAITAEE